MIQISNRLKRKIIDLYGVEAAERVMDRLRTLDLPDEDEHSERIQAAIVFGAERRAGGLEAMAQLAEQDWRDALLAGGLGNDDWPRLLDDWLFVDDIED